LKSHREPVLYEGLSYIIPLIVLFLILSIIGRHYLSLLPLSIATFIAFFFRNPERRIPSGEGIIVSPADGKVIEIQHISEGDLRENGLKIGIFLSLFDVHVNRIPCSGEVVDLRHKRGRFLPAFKESASIENEQVSMIILHNTYKVIIKQIAGIIARRIVCWVKVGDKVMKGQRYGLIRFGSRVDIFLPEETEIKVRIGDKVKGGESIIGILR